MQAVFEKFLEDPTAENYLAARTWARRQASYCPLALELVALERMLVAQQYQQVLQQVEELLPGCALSPRLHLLAAQAALEIEDFDLGELEQFMFQACLQGIMATGVGTTEEPYVVTHLTDVRDVLNALGVTGCSQQSVELFGEVFDVITTPDEHRMWFNVTGLLIPLPALAKHSYQSQ